MEVSLKELLVSVTAFLVFPSAPGPAISGETSTDEYFGGAAFAKATVIEVESFDFGVENPTSIGSASAGVGAGKAKFEQLTIRKSVDKSSPALFAALGSGAHFSSVLLYLRKAGATASNPYLAYEFQTVFVTKIDWNGSEGDDGPAETVSFAFGALQVVYRTTNPDGTLGSTTQTAWSQVTNTAALIDNQNLI